MPATCPAHCCPLTPVAGNPSILLEECVGVQVNTDDISRGIVQVKIAGVDAHDEGHGGAQDVRQHQWAQRNVGALPMQWEDHLQSPGARAM